MFYEWHALGPDISQVPVAQGIMSGDEPAAAQRAAERFLRTGQAFLATVTECWPQGLSWTGRRNDSGGVTWRRRA